LVSPVSLVSPASRPAASSQHHRGAPRPRAQQRPPTRCRNSTAQSTVDSSWSQSRRCPEGHRRGQPLHSQARNAKNPPESTICRVARKQQTTTGSVLWRVPIPFPGSAPRRAGRTNNLRTPCPILKGLCNPAQGRPVAGQRGDGPTLGNRVKSSPTLKAVASHRPTPVPAAIRPRFH